MLYRWLQLKKYGPARVSLPYSQGRRLRGEKWGIVPSKILGGGNRGAYIPQKFHKYLRKYKFLQCFPLFVLAPVLCV